MTPLRLQRSLRLCIARHGETTSPGLLLGQADPPLSARGRRQAAILAERLRDSGAQFVLSSGLRRAIETAEILATSLELPLESDPRLNEISHGDWDGRRWAGIESSDPETARRKLSDWWGVIPAGGESAEQFYQRVEAAWRSLLGRVATAGVVVAHGGVNAVLLDLARRTASNTPPNSDISNPDIPSPNIPNPDISNPDWRAIESFQQEHGGYVAIDIPPGDLQ